MTTIEVTTAPTAGGWSCLVRVSEGASASEHTVRVTRDDLHRLAPGDTEPTDLVRRSFAFLLEREPKESILRSFDLPLIGRYFPEYDATLAR
jgi:hypothetical protein